MLVRTSNISQGAMRDNDASMYRTSRFEERASHAVDRPREPARALHRVVTSHRTLCSRTSRLSATIVAQSYSTKRFPEQKREKA